MLRRPPEVLANDRFRRWLEDYSRHAVQTKGINLERSNVRRNFAEAVAKYVDEGALQAS